MNNKDLQPTDALQPDLHKADVSSSAVAKLKDELDKLTDDERMELFSSYCRYCGSKDAGCQCWNDE